MRRERNLRTLKVLAALCLAGTFAATSAHAADSGVTVYVDQAKVLSITGIASTVVVGNPMIADVSLQSDVLAVHGRHFGTTNVIVLDNHGNELAALEVNVIRPESKDVEIFKGGTEGKVVGKYSYVCSPDCESVMMPGDDIDYNTSISTQVAAKSKEALSSAQASGQ